jgi:hypothetical protein
MKLAVAFWKRLCFNENLIYKFLDEIYQDSSIL